MSGLGAILPFVLVLGVFWFLILRPQQRRQRELRALQSSLNAGDEVMLTSGIFATVSGVTDDHILVDIASGVTVRVARGAIAQVLPTTEPQTDAPGGAAPDGDAAGSEEN